MKKYESEMVTMVEAGTILGVSYDTTVKLCVTGKIKRLNMNPDGRRPVWRVYKESIYTFLDMKKNQ